MSLTKLRNIEEEQCFITVYSFEVCKTSFMNLTASTETVNSSRQDVMVMFITVSSNIVPGIWLRFSKYLLNEWEPSFGYILLFPLYREKNEAQERM